MVYTWGDKKNGRIYDEDRPYWTMNNDIGTIISVWVYMDLFIILIICIEIYPNTIYDE